MKTEIIKLTDESRAEALDKAARVIKSGQLVVLPTETVYGLGADATNDSALEKIFLAKGRPSDNPIIVHIATREQLDRLAESVSSLEQKLIDKFWPGPLTIIFPKRKSVSSVLSGGLDTVAVRMPTHTFMTDLILLTDTPIGAPSANISGRPSGTRGEHAFSDLADRVDLIIDDGESKIGLESTVVKVSGNTISILRAGAVTKEMLSSIEEGVVVNFALDKKDLNASPGTRYKHYAPKVPLEISGDIVSRLKDLEKEGKRVGIICTEEDKDLFIKNGNVFVWGRRDDLDQVSRNLYSALRFFDDKSVDTILCGEFKEEGMGAAIMDRLRKASSS